MIKRFYDYTNNEWAEEEDLRKVLLEFETNDILSNLEEYATNIMSMYAQTRQLELACYDDIEEVVKVLNESWGCEIVSEEKYYIDRYTFLSSKVGELESQLEETKNEIEKVQFNIHRLNGGK